MGGLSPSGGVALGIVVGLLSTGVQSVGLTLQRKSHMLEDSKSEYEPRRAPYRRRRWQIGMFLFLLANIVGSTIQITTLPLPLLSTLQASGLVFNSIMASLILKEAWTLRTFYGTLLVAGGAVLISFFSAVPEPSHNLEQLVHLLWMRSFLIWFGMSLLFVFGVLVIDFCLRHFIAVHRRQSAKVLLIRGMLYGMLSGILSAHALLLAKSAVELIVRSLADHNNQFKSYESWLLILAFLVLALTQLYYLHLGLKLVSTSILYPFVFCIYNIVAILDGLIYFRQMDRLPPLHAGLIALGTAILLSGVLALSWRLNDGEEEEADDPEHLHRHQMLKAEIPQTVLTPGLGFLGDPDSDSQDGSAVADEDGNDDEVDRERSPLLSQRGIKRPQTHSSIRRGGSVSSLAGSRNGKRRKRAATLREVLDIWEELGDGDTDAEEERYGTFTVGRPASAGAAPGSKRHSVSHNRHQQRRRRASAVIVRDPDPDADAITLSTPEEVTLGEDEPEPLGSLGRAKTMPVPSAVSHSRRRRKSAIAGAHAQRVEGGALFRDLLRAEWWRTRSKKGDGEDEEDDVEEENRGR